MTISFKIPDGALARIRANVEQRIADRMENLAVMIYNSIVTGPQPVWSGAYASSWAIGVGEPTVIDNVSPGARRAGHQYVPAETFTPAEPIVGTIGVMTPYEPIYISNYSMRTGDAGIIEGHAGIIEHVGSPKHPEPWNIAAHAKSIALTAARYF